MRIPPRIVSVTALAAALLVGGPVAASASAVPDHHAPTSTAYSVTSVTSAAAVGDICYSKLPDQAHDTLDLIEAGGPYPYPQDDTVFSNREGILPSQSSGYYHEYTVVTPGSPDRGARRVVTGEKDKEDYYTADHYESFDLVDYAC